jgi:methyl-accepting chemotaxis protein
MSILKAIAGVAGIPEDVFANATQLIEQLQTAATEIRTAVTQMQESLNRIERGMRAIAQHLVEANGVEQHGDESNAGSNSSAVGSGNGTGTGV